MEQLPEAWRSFLAGRYDAALLAQTLRRVEEERAAGTRLSSGRRSVSRPPADAARRGPGGAARPGPYHDDGQAQGLAFSVPAGVRFPPSLRNIFKEYAADLGRPVPKSGSLEGWAREGCSCSTVC